MIFINYILEDDLISTRGNLHGIHHITKKTHFQVNGNVSDTMSII